MRGLYLSSLSGDLRLEDYSKNLAIAIEAQYSEVKVSPYSLSPRHGIDTVDDVTAEVPWCVTERGGPSDDVLAYNIESVLSYYPSPSQSISQGDHLFRVLNQELSPYINGSPPHTQSYQPGQRPSALARRSSPRPTGAKLPFSPFFCAQTTSPLK